MTRKTVWLLFGATTALSLVGFISFYLGSRSASASPAETRSSNENAPVQIAASSQLTPDQIFQQRFHRDFAPLPAPASSANGQDSQSAQLPGTMTLTFRAISLNRSTGDATANLTIAQNVLDEIHKSSVFNPEASRFIGKLSDEESPGTFTFTIAATLKKPLKL